MARKTALDIVNLVRIGMSSPSTDEWSDDEILSLVNLKQTEIVATHMPETIEVTTSLAVTQGGGATYEVGVDDCMYVTQVHNTTDGIRMRPSNRDDNLRLTQGVSAIYGPPTEYFIHGRGANSQKQITTFPVPNGNKTLTIYYNKIPDDLVLLPTPTVSEISEEWDLTLIDMTISYGLALDQQRREAMAHKSFADEAEERASRTKPPAPERRWGVETPVARAIRPATKRGR